MAKFSQNRTMNKGMLLEAREEATKLRILIDAIWKSLIDLGAPMDRDLAYTDNIDVRRLDCLVSDLKTRKVELTRIQLEIERLEAELGETGA